MINILTVDLEDWFQSSLELFGADMSYDEAFIKPKKESQSTRKDFCGSLVKKILKQSLL